MQPDGPALFCSRFGPEVYEQLGRTGSLPSALASAGIALELRTLGCQRLRARGRLVRRIDDAEEAVFDLEREGQPVARAHVPGDALEFDLVFELRSSPYVRLHLPATHSAGFVALETDGPLQPQEPRRRVLWALGDSVTQGLHLAGPSDAFPRVAADAMGLDLHNAGIAGIEAVAVPDLRAPPDLGAAVLQLGINDWAGDIEPEAAVAAVRSRWASLGVPAVVVPPLPWPALEGSPRGPKLAAFRRAFLEEAGQQGLPLLDIAGLSEDPADYDHCHPGRAVHRALGLLVAAELQRIRRPPQPAVTTIPATP